MKCSIALMGPCVLFCYPWNWHGIPDKGHKASFENISNPWKCAENASSIDDRDESKIPSPPFPGLRTSLKA